MESGAVIARKNAPMDDFPREKLSTVLLNTFSPESDTRTLGEVVDGLDHHGMGIILILFSIPAAIPLPAAGYSTVLSIPLFIIGIRLLLAHETIWLPEKIRAKDFSPKQFSRVYKWMMKVTLYIERFSRPRMVYLGRSKTAKTGLGLLICLLAASMVLPIPGTNTLPAGGIFLIGFGLLEDDGLLILAGILYSLAALAVSILVILFGYEVVKAAILSLS